MSFKASLVAAPLLALSFLSVASSDIDAQSTEVTRDNPCETVETRDDLLQCLHYEEHTYSNSPAIDWARMGEERRSLPDEFYVEMRQILGSSISCERPDSISGLLLGVDMVDMDEPASPELIYDVYALLQSMSFCKMEQAALSIKYGAEEQAENFRLSGVDKATNAALLEPQSRNPCALMESVGDLAACLEYRRLYEPSISALPLGEEYTSEFMREVYNLTRTFDACVNAANANGILDVKLGQMIASVADPMDLYQMDIPEEIRELALTYYTEAPKCYRAFADLLDNSGVVTWLSQAYRNEADRMQVAAESLKAPGP